MAETVKIKIETTGGDQLAQNMKQQMPVVV
jgi:hypothetical protein